jgi:hypothetical protein
MDWTGQKLAESLCIYLTLGFGLVAFVVGYARQDFGLMMKVIQKKGFLIDGRNDRSIDSFMLSPLFCVLCRFDA